MSTSADRIRTAAPITLVTSFAVYGQFAWGLANLPPHTLIPIWVIAAGAALAFESLSLYVQWHAHDALLRRDSTRAARLRAGSYLFAGIAAAVNYSHFSNGWHPTPGAVMFALFSMSSPWLWGLHTRRAHNIQLRSEGRYDDTGALFSAERRRNFPIRTWAARRYSIDYGITDARIAWEAYRTYRLTRRAARAANRVSPVQVELPSVVDVPELERHEDIVVPDPEQVDDNGLSKWWQTAPPVNRPDPAPKPARRFTRNQSEFLKNPPAEAIELAKSGIGKVRLRQEIADQLHISITPYEARTLLEHHRPTNGHKVPTS